MNNSEVDWSSSWVAEMQYISKNIPSGGALSHHQSFREQITSQTKSTNRSSRDGSWMTICPRTCLHKSRLRVNSGWNCLLEAYHHWVDTEELLMLPLVDLNLKSIVSLCIRLIRLLTLVYWRLFERRFRSFWCWNLGEERVCGFGRFPFFIFIFQFSSFRLEFWGTCLRLFTILGCWIRWTSQVVIVYIFPRPKDLL